MLLTRNVKDKCILHLSLDFRFDVVITDQEEIMTLAAKYV